MASVTQHEVGSEIAAGHAREVEVAGQAVVNKTVDNPLQPKITRDGRRKSQKKKEADLLKSQIYYGELGKLTAAEEAQKRAKKVARRLLERRNFEGFPKEQEDTRLPFAIIGICSSAGRWILLCQRKYQTLRAAESNQRKRCT